jgi:hypothetical protein
MVWEGVSKFFLTRQYECRKLSTELSSSTLPGKKCRTHSGCIFDKNMSESMVVMITTTRMVRPKHSSLLHLGRRGGGGGG